MATALSVRKTQEVLDQLAGKDKFIPAVSRNHMQLYSFYKPSLEAGNYTIEAVQTINSQSFQPNSDRNAVWPVATKRVFNKTSKDDTSGHVVAQRFEVMAPQFSIEQAMINSFYPPEGHQDEARILPHIVLNDPHFPWEREAGKSDQVRGLRDADVDESGKQILSSSGQTVYRSKVPWIALLVFDPSELKLTAQQAQELKIPGFSMSDAKDISQAPANGSFLMQVKDYLGMPPSQRINFEQGLSNDPEELQEISAHTEMTQVIFPSKGTVKMLFPDVDHLEANKYLAHVRAVNTIGFPDAGVEQVGNFSIVISARTANMNITEPSTQICHLVSIEHLDSTLPGILSAIAADPKATDERIGLVSLFAWTYTALPPNPVNFVDTIENLVSGMQTLRIPEENLAKLKAAIADPPVSDQLKPAEKQDILRNMYKRLSAGYSLARWRCETGEETAAFNRGPLVPQPVRSPPVDDWCASSNTSKEYQILDKSTGLMDLSYSSAWQLGKTLAIADTGFNSALMRFRSQVYSWALSRAQKTKDDVTNKNALIMKLSQDLKGIVTVTSQKNAVPRRVIPTNPKNQAPNAIDNPKLRVALRTSIKNVTNALSSTTGDAIWDEWSLHEPKNDDWAVISSWITQKLSLCDIPAHVLVPDPSYIPEESLRFFHIDDTWMDCMIDGALSVANHLDRDDDLVRTYIKQVYNEYLNHEIKGRDKDGKVVSTGIKPQIPCYGFILRSQIVKVMPDLRITVKWWSPTPEDEALSEKMASVCRYTKLDDTTILCLLDRQPEELDSIVLEQPPHQQRFSIGYALFQDINPNNSYLAMRLRRLYTKGAPDTEWPEAPADSDNPWPDHVLPGKGPNWYDWNSRMVQVKNLATDINHHLRFSAGDQAYQDFVPTSSELAMELNDPCYYFAIKPQLDQSAKRTVTPRNRQLWNKETPMSPQEPVKEDTTVSQLLSNTSEPVGVPLATEASTIDASKIPARVGGSNGITWIDKTSVISPQSRAPPQGTTPRRCFTLEVFADYKGPMKQFNDPNAYLATKTDYLYDLIFNVRRIPSTRGLDQLLQEITIYIPHTGYSNSDEGKKLQVEPLLYDTYADARARMIANQRFVVFLVHTKTHLEARLIPRGATSFPSNDKQVPTTMSIKDRRSEDLSFRLAEVDVPAVTFKKSLPAYQTTEGGNVKIFFVERYVMSNGQVYNAAGNGGQPCYVVKLNKAQ